MHAMESLAAWVLSPQAVYDSKLALRQAKWLVLDSIGCACAAIEARAVDAVLDHVDEMGGRAEATVIGFPAKTSVLNAVLANGALVRVLDLNDVMFMVKNGFLNIGGHRSDNIPVALAVGEKSGRGGKAVLESIILNYELYGRLRELIQEHAPWDGASASGIVSAAMTGRLMGLDAGRLAHGMALAAARSATPKIVRYGDISAAKSLANALVAHNGVQAALLAAKGVTGPLEILDHRKAGIFQVFDPDLGLEQLWQDIPAVPQILNAHVKSYPSIGTSQTLVKAALDMHVKLKGRASAIESIEVTMSDVPAVRRQQTDRSRLYPKSREAADHSFAYIVAVTLLDGELTHHQFDGERWLKDPAVRRLMECVKLEVSQDLSARAPGSMPSSLRVKLAGGEEIIAECLYPPGHSFADRGLDLAVVEAKFHEVAQGVLAEPERRKVVDEVVRMDSQSSLAPLMSLLTKVKRV